MAPGNNERHPGNTGTIPKTKVRNNCNVPQEAVTPTRRDMTSNLGSTSLDWVPVSEYNSRSNHNQSRKQTNNTSDQELTDLDNSVSIESGFGRFVPVRPQPRALPLSAQHQNIPGDTHEDGTSSTASGNTLHPYAHQMQNGLIPHSNHAAAAVMIVNPTTPNAITGNMSQPFNAPNQNRNNLTRNLNPARNNFEGNSRGNNNSTPPLSNTNSRGGTKTVNLINNMYDQQGQGSLNNLNDNNHIHRESARALGEAIVAACPDAAAVERRLGQIREYIRVTSSLVDTMRNSEDEAFIEHTKEEYDELVQMVMQLKESETKLESMLAEKGPDNIEVPSEENDETNAQTETTVAIDESAATSTQDNVINVKTNNNSNNVNSNNLKKVTNLENEQINKTLQGINETDDTQQNSVTIVGAPLTDTLSKVEENCEETDSSAVKIEEIESTNPEQEIKKDDQLLNEILRKNILSCVEKVALIEEMKNKNGSNNEIQQDVVVRPVSVQSNGSVYSENELWQNEIKNKMEMSQIRLATLKQQQKRLIKYQEEAKQQLEEMNRERQQVQEIHPSTSHDTFNIQNPFSGNFHHPNRMFAANQIGVATTLPHSSDTMHGQNMSNNMDNEHQSAQSTHSHEGRFSHREANIASSEEAGGGGRDSEGEEDDGLLSERGRMLQMKLRELQLKKQHMENLVTEFQKLQMATRAGSSRNTYSSSGEDSGVEETTRKFVGNKSGGNLKNEDPFKLMEIKAIKTALQKTKDLMRSVENYEAEHLSGVPDDSFQMPTHSNIHDNKSEGGGSMGGWSNEGSVCRVRNSLPQRHKFTNEQHSQQHQHQQQLNHHQPIHHQQQHNHQQQLNHQQPLNHQQHQQIQHQQALQQLQQHHQQLHQQHQQQQQNHEANLASLQELAQELRLETEKIMGERARMKDLVSNKEPSRKQKKVNEEAMGSAWPLRPGPAERRQMQLRALLADKQRELEALLNKEKVLCAGQEGQNQRQDSRTASVVNQSYASEQEEPDSRSEQILLDSQNSRENDNYRTGGDSALGSRSMNTVPSHMGSNYGSDSDSASRNKSNQRNRMRRRQPQDRQLDDSNVNVSQVNNTSQSSRHEARAEASNVNMVPPISPSDNPSSNAYPHQPPPCWNTNKSNQDMRNQFTQNSHSQTMERLLGTPQMSFPPSMPFNMMMPYGMVSGCSCGCSYWGAWFWQQIVMQQREIHQLRDQLNHLEERWRAETASHTLNNQVPPGNRANNYWDNFRSYSRQNLLSANSKTNADGHLGAGAGPAAPLAARSHNALRRAPPPKRNTNPPPPPPHPHPPPEEPPRTNLAYQRSLSFSSAPDVLNVNQVDPEAAAAAVPHSRNDEGSNTNVNLNRQDPQPFRNINIANPIPEIIQSHSNNLTTANSKRKSSSKLPAKNSRRNYTLDYAQTSNINIASTSETPNPNLASTSREVHDKATSKLFDLLRENVYSEVTTLIGVNESHPDFLIQLFRELQLISSDPLRQKVLQSIRNVLAQYDIIDSQNNENIEENLRPEAVVTSTSAAQDCNPLNHQNESTSSMPIDSKIIRFLLQNSEDICSSELLDVLASLILSSTGDGRQKQQSKKRVHDLLTKYEGMRVSDVSGDIIESLPSLMSGNHEGEESAHPTSELSESSILQDVAGSLNLFSSSDTQLHNACPYDMWPGHVHMDVDGAELTDDSPRSSNEGKVDLLNCTEMHNGDLAEADQSCRPQAGAAGTGGAGGDREAAAGHVEALPDVVDTDEATPTEAEAEWLGLDRVPTRLHIEDSSVKQKD